LSSTRRKCGHAALKAIRKVSTAARMFLAGVSSPRRKEGKTDAMFYIFADGCVSAG
jgi:hypothetical protein